jgi:hypothetical protein
MEWVCKEQCGHVWWCLIHYISCIPRFFFVWMALVTKVHEISIIATCVLSWHLPLFMVCNHFVCLMCYCICYIFFCNFFYYWVSQFHKLHKIAFFEKGNRLILSIFHVIHILSSKFDHKVGIFLSSFFHFVINILFEPFFFKIQFLYWTWCFYIY